MRIFPFQGPCRTNYKKAKQAAALEVVKLLHQSGHLDNHLAPVKIPKEILDAKYWFPNWDFSDNEKQEKAKERQDSSDNTLFSQIRVSSFSCMCKWFAS